MITGKVKFFNAQKGYGFIAPEDGGKDAFVHVSALEKAGLSNLSEDQQVSYELETDARGKTSAVNLQVELTRLSPPTSYSLPGPRRRRRVQFQR